MPWRAMTAEDLPQVKVLADTIHVDYPEEMEVFADRLRLYPQGCHVLCEDGRPIGYALTHPWTYREPPPLNTPLRELPRAASTYYIHDMALLPEGRGKGYAGQGIRLLADHAQAAGFGNMSLVAVNRSQPFWEKWGFRGETLPDLQAKLRSYGPDAVLMVRKLGEAAG